MKKFTGIEYKGGHPDMAKPCTISLTVDDYYKEIILKGTGFFSITEKATIKVADIINISFDEKTKRSIGRTVAGAAIGGVLTGGIGLLVGGALGAGRRDISNLYITANINGKEKTIILKAGKQADDIYATIAGIP
jgi:hypothetical protein